MRQQMKTCPGRPATLLLVLLMLSAWGCSSAQTDTSARQRLDIGQRTFHLELAMDPAARYQGLSDRAELASDGGMLFVFPRPAEACFVMRRCLIPLDLVFVGPNGRIVSMHRMEIEPYDTPERQLRKYCSLWPAQAAIEFAAGTIDELELRVGDRLNLPLDELKRQAE